jgi:hypothetical protein
VLVCYLDDSGKDPQNPITTVAGYAGTEDQWGGFEIEVESVFADYRVKVLHAKDLHNTDNELTDGPFSKSKLSLLGFVECCHITLRLA